MLPAVSSNPLGYTGLIGLAKFPTGVTGIMTRFVIVDLKWPIIGVLLYFGIRYSQQSGLFASVADVVKAVATQVRGAARMELSSRRVLIVRRENVPDAVQPNEITEIRP
jgi:hypothetical protein